MLNFCYYFSQCSLFLFYIVLKKNLSSEYSYIFFIYLLLDTLKNETNNYCCPPSFDGLFCWPRTLPGLLATLPCPPKFVMGYKNPENTVATKQCMSNGEWYENHDDIKWSNYSLCTPPSGIINIEIHHSNYETAYNSSIVQVRKQNMIYFIPGIIYCFKYT